jgi:hypothetical protein
VQAEHGVHLRVLHHAFLDHEFRARVPSAGGAPSSAGWKMNFTDPAGDL